MPNVEAARANYASSSNLEKRQAAAGLVTGLRGTAPQEVVARLPPGSRVLDVGCGNGGWFDKVPEPQLLVGVDLSDVLAVEAQQRARGPVAVGDAMTLPVQDGVFDAVLMLWMLYHVPDKQAALREACRVLRNDGTLIAATNSGEENGRHLEIMWQALDTVAERPAGGWLERLDFDSETGAEVLGRVFGSVETVPFEADGEWPDPGVLVAYLDSLKEPVEAQYGGPLDWPAVLAAASELAAIEIEDEGAIRFVRQGATFVGTNPT